MITDPCDFVPEHVRCFGKAYMKRWRQTRQTLTTYDYWRTLFITAAISRFTWEGLPESIDARYLELTLALSGSFAITRRTDRETAVNPYWGGRFSQIGQSDIYMNPVAVQVIAPNGFQQRRHAVPWVKRKGNQYARSAEVMRPDCAIVYDNVQRTSLLPYIDLQARRLAQYDAAADQHVNAMKVPYVFVVSEEGRRNAQEFFNRIDSGQPALYMGQDAMDNVNMSVLQTMQASGYAGDKILNDELKIVSQVYTMLGIDSNAAAEKKERVQTAETLANNEQFMIQRNSAQAARDEGCKRMFDVFGIECRAKWAVRHVEEVAGSDLDLQ